LGGARVGFLLVGSLSQGLLSREDKKGLVALFLDVEVANGS
jgi:hypothetical protein